MDSFVAFVSGSVAAALAAVAPLVTHQRRYSTPLNEQQLQKVVDALPDDACWTFGPHEYHKRRWTPTCMIACSPIVYCVALTTVTSDNDPNRQAFDALVMRPVCCGGWAAFDRRIKRTGGEDDETDDATASDRLGAPRKKNADPHVELLHVVVTYAELSYPRWATTKRSLLPPGVKADDPELACAAALAAEIHASLLPNGSGVFLVCGPKKTGKSSAARLIGANHLRSDALVCDEFDPTTPGNLLSMIEEVRNQHDPDAELLVILEEVTWLRRIARQKPEDPPPTPHPTLKTQVTMKDDWNSWPERAVKIPNCIVVLTANFSDEVRAEFDVLQDGSMLRDKRITAEFTMLPEGGYRRRGGAVDATPTKLTTPPMSVDAMVRSDSELSIISSSSINSYDGITDACDNSLTVSLL